MREIEESLFFVLDEKGHSVHLTDRGSAALSPHDPGLFIVPDISLEIHAVEHDPDLSTEEKAAQRQKDRGRLRGQERAASHHSQAAAGACPVRGVKSTTSCRKGRCSLSTSSPAASSARSSVVGWLHQAVEAKEGRDGQGRDADARDHHHPELLPDARETVRRMTGTAETEETEFFSIYKLEVAVIPTNKPMRRVDHADQIYKTRREKYNAVADEVERIHAGGWPVLIGTTSVDVSETLSRQLKRQGLTHEVLNAKKYHQREAEIVAGAGQKGAITIATNMAGRGTDIKLDQALDLATDEAGLHIIGTERHESRRIDRQLRGRSGRQGDPGVSLFFLSLEDDLMRLFGSDRIALRMMDKSGSEEGEVITGKMIAMAIEGAQKRVEVAELPGAQASARSTMTS